jgi:hypothetical protein
VGFPQEPNLATLNNYILRKPAIFTAWVWDPAGVSCNYVLCHCMGFDEPLLFPLLG